MFQRKFTVKGLKMKNFIYDKAKKDQLPILLETSVWRNVVAYERYGFKTYHVWDDVPNNIKVWFMKLST